MKKKKNIKMDKKTRDLFTKNFNVYVMFSAISGLVVFAIGMCVGLAGTPYVAIAERSFSGGVVTGVYLLIVGIVLRRICSQEEEREQLNEH
ncbi:hypothetical protein [Vibrio sp. 10N.261.46.A3]|uniref:hypothetical protein n=1 Tax=Vibrio sp. 10N.261.46.A3 TaxID=3229658 RepID=UPI00354B5262